MVLIKLPWKDRKVISEVAKIYCRMATSEGCYDEQIRQFWRISMYVKAGLLSREDLKTITTAMEAFNETYKKSGSHRDPDGYFSDMDQIIPKMRALIPA